MNILKYPIASAERLEEAGKAILGGSPVFEVTNEDLYIKEVGTGKMIPVGGHCKQNKLTAGDNIEILTEKEDDESVTERTPEIRLTDDIVVHTVTVNPDEGNLPNWKATIKLGELTNGNAVFLITKATEVKDDVQGIIGGELVIKMETESGKTYYAEYEFTITSTGSWSLWGGSEAGTNARVCKVKYNEEWYYGIKIPAGDFTNIKKVDTPDIEELTSTVRTYLQMGELDGDTKFYIGAASKSNVPLTKIKETTSDGVSTGRYSVSVKSLVDNLGWSSLVDNSDIYENQWKTWYDADATIIFTIKHQQISGSAWKVYDTSDVLYLYKTNINTKVKAQATYALQRGNTRITFIDRGATHETEIATYTQADGTTKTGIYIKGENLSPTYNHWHEMTVADFQTVCGITFKGEWAKYAADTNYWIGFRIYTKTDSFLYSWTRINCIQIVDKSYTHTLTERRGGYYGKVVVDFEATELDPPFTWTSILMNLKDDSYEYDERYINMLNYSTVALGTFSDRTPQNTAVAERIMITNVALSSGMTSDDDYIKNYFNSAYVVDNYNEVSAFTSNRIPLFQSSWDDADEIATLYYEGQDDVKNKDTYSFFVDFINNYEQITGHHYSYQTFTDNLKITNSEFWYNGWDIRNESLIPVQPNDDSLLEYQVLSRESNDDDSFSELFYFDGSTMSKVVAKIDACQELGEDAPPYKFILKNMTLSLTDLQLLADNIKRAERQVYLDLSNCTVDSTAQKWSASIFEGCSSLRGMTVPQGIVNISAAAWLWCTYMRELDLTSSVSTLTTLGASTGYNTSLGLLTSTRVRDFILPRNVEQLNAYIVYSSNIKNMIYLHQSGDDPIKVVEWTFMGINNKGSETQDLGQDFHMFFETDYLKELKAAYTSSTGSLYNLAYQMGSQNNPSGNSDGWWTTQAVESFVTFDKDWTQSEWQDFNNTYNWGEELINQIRREFGATTDIEIIDYK